jgi:hypothetical protein
LAQSEGKLGISAMWAWIVRKRIFVAGEKASVEDSFEQKHEQAEIGAETPALERHEVGKYVRLPYILCCPYIERLTRSLMYHVALSFKLVHQ